MPYGATFGGSVGTPRAWRCAYAPSTSGQPKYRVTSSWAAARAGSGAGGRTSRSYRVLSITCASPWRSHTQSASSPGADDETTWKPSASR
jgi:hypothetical protein